MAKYRSSTQIMTCILETTAQKGREGIKITELLTKANVSHPRIMPMLHKFTQSGLMNEIVFDGKNTWILTEKGLMYLQEYKKFDDMAHSFGLEL